jgi:hypothetical protein
VGAAFQPRCHPPAMLFNRGWKAAPTSIMHGIEEFEETLKEK